MNTPSAFYIHNVSPKDLIFPESGTQVIDNSIFLSTTNLEVSNIKEFNNNNVIVGDLKIDPLNNTTLEDDIKTFMKTHKKINLAYIPFNSTDFTRYPPEVHFPLKQHIKSFIIQQLQIIFPTHSFEISGDIVLIAQQNRKFTIPSLGTTQFNLVIFKIYINEYSKSISRLLYVQLLIESSTQQIVQINHLEFDVLPVDTQLFTFKSPLNNPEYVETTGKLFLQKPFNTNESPILFASPRSLDMLETPRKIDYDMMCFGDIGNKTTITNKSQCQDALGVWDSPVSIDTDCPFFMANKNYPNTFGAKQGYACSLPQGTKPLGYRYYSPDPNYAPLCYNCSTDLIGQGTLGRCCDKQVSTLEYPKLDGPDYAFPNDYTQRQQNEELFTYRGLKTL